jgi:hypothetical protein
MQRSARQGSVFLSRFIKLQEKTDESKSMQVLSVMPSRQKGIAALLKLLPVKTLSYSRHKRIQSCLEVRLDVLANSIRQLL